MLNVKRVISALSPNKKMNLLNLLNLLNLHDTPYIYYQQILPDNNFPAFQNDSLSSKAAHRTGICDAPYQQNFEVNVGTQRKKMNCYGTPSQLEFLEIPLVYYKSDQHQTIQYDQTT